MSLLPARGPDNSNDRSFVAIPLEPPPERVYPSKQQLLADCQEHAKQAGYAVSIYRTDAANRSIVLACVCYGRPLNRWKLTSETRKRPNRSSKKTGCRMHCFCKEQQDGTWLLEVRVAEHNHTPAPAGTYAAHRKRGEAVKEAIAHDMWSGSVVRSTQAALQQRFPGVVLTKRDIFNERAQIKTQALDGLSMVEALLKELSNGHYYHAYQTFGADHPQAGRISHLLIIHPKSLEIWRYNSDVLLLDCTYKTNRYNYPLLDLVGCTGMNTSFNVGLCFLHKEVQEDFHWALSQLKLIFHGSGVRDPGVIVTDRDLALLNALNQTFPHIPTLLCQWHINQCVLKKARTFMPQVRDDEYSDDTTTVYKDSDACKDVLRAWQDIVNADTEDDLRQRVEDLRQKHLAVAQYCEYEWLALHKEKIVRAWTKEIPHYGSISTSRVEGCHAKVKRYLQSSRNNLYCFFRLMVALWSSEHNEHEIAMAQDKVSRAANASNHIFDFVAYNVTRHAIARCKIPTRLERVNLSRCTGTYTRTLGLPCKHKIIDCLDGVMELQRSDFHRHWWTDHTPSIAPPQTTMGRPREPAPIRQRRQNTVRGRGRGRAGTGVHGTRRELSDFERIPRTQYQDPLPASRAHLSVDRPAPSPARPPSQHHTTAEASPAPTQSIASPLATPPPRASQTPQAQPYSPQWVWLEGSRRRGRTDPLLPNKRKEGLASLRLPAPQRKSPSIEDMRREIERQSPGLQLAHRTLQENSVFFDSRASSEVAEPSSRSQQPTHPRPSQPSLSDDESDQEFLDALASFDDVASEAEQHVSPTPSRRAHSHIWSPARQTPPPPPPVLSQKEQHDLILYEAIELARMVKSKGKVAPLLDGNVLRRQLATGDSTTDLRDILVSNMLARNATLQQQDGESREAFDVSTTARQQSVTGCSQDSPSRSKPICMCSRRCGTRCGCRRRSEACQPGCHKSLLHTSIRDAGDSICCGNIRNTADGRKLFPAGWTVTETITRTVPSAEAAAEARAEIDFFVGPNRSGEIFDEKLEAQDPAALLISKAGGIDAFLVQQGYGPEFGLKRGVNLTPKARHALDTADMPDIRRTTARQPRSAKFLKAWSKSTPR